MSEATAAEIMDDIPWTAPTSYHQSAPPGCPIMAIHIRENKIVGNCNWTRSEIITYCAYMAGYSDMSMQALAVVTQVYRTFSIPFGILSNALLIITLQSSVLSGTTFDYLRILAALQLIKTLLSIGSADFGHVFDAYFESESILSAAWRCALFQLMIPSLMDLCKLSACLLSFFLLLERFLAVAMPHRFSKMDIKKFYKLTVASSILSGCFELIRIAEVSTDQPDQHIVRYTWLGLHAVYFTYVKTLIVSIKSIIVILMTIFGLIIADRLRRRSRQIMVLSSGETALREFRDTLSLARFQIIDTVVMIIEIGWAVIADVTISVLNSSINRLDDTPCDYEIKMAQVFGYRLCGVYLPHSTNMIQSLGHGELFFIYLICFKKFRRGFLDMCRKAYHKAGNLKNGATGGVNVVIVSAAS